MSKVLISKSTEFLKQLPVLYKRQLPS